MAVPKHKVSKERGNKRFASNYKAHSANLAVCPQCHELKPTHRVCPKCGYYNSKLVVAPKPEKDEE